jgi:hypothetical protein
MKTRFLFFMAFVILTGCCQRIGETFLTSRTPCDYYLPDRFVGWAAVRFAVPSAQPLPIIASRYQVHFRVTGQVSTSTRFEEGSARDRYFYYSANGRTLELKATGWGEGGMIWNGRVGSSSDRPKDQLIQAFFVGTEQQLNSHVGGSPPE